MKNISIQNIFIDLNGRIIYNSPAIFDDYVKNGKSGIKKFRL